MGKVGERGTTRQSSNENVDNEIGQRIQEDYSEITGDELSVLVIEYAVNDSALRDELDKKNAIEEMMDETLGWTGLGHCDGGNIDDGTMKIACMVVDFDLAKQMIENELMNSPYKDFKRIYKEESE